MSDSWAEEKFWPRVDKSGECWLWTGATNARGYGTCWRNGVKWRTSRVAWDLARGPIPPGLCVCHRCDNPLCVRADHLFLGTNDDNVRDRNFKGRAARGESHGSCKLTDEQVAHMRAEYALCRVTHRELAQRYGVSPGHVTHLLSGKKRGT